MRRAAFVLPVLRSLANLGSRRLTLEQVLWAVLGLLVALFFWLLISGQTATGRGWT
jgi:hypothetical protein